MPTASSFLEIVELEDGKIVLRRSDAEGEPLVKIEFSEDTRAFLTDATMDVAKAMIGAGIELVSEMYDLYDIEDSGQEYHTRSIH